MKILTDRKSLSFFMAIAVFLLGTSTILAAENSRVVNETSGGTFTDLQAAINAANSGDTLLLRGHFYGTFFIEKSLTLLGSQKAILDGNNSVQVLNIGYNGDAIVNLENLTIKNGSATNGGGILNIATLTLKRCKIVNNTATESGGGIANFDTNPNDDTFTGPASLTIIDSEISNNSSLSSSGGGILSLGGTLTINNSKFKNNTASISGGGVDTNSTTAITNSEFKGNTGRYGGALSAETDGITVVDKVVFTKNTATTYGGAIYGNSTVTVNFSNFGKNVAQSSGGAIYIGSGIFTINNSRITNNSANISGGGICQYPDTTLLINQSLIEDNSPNDIAE